MTKNVSAVAAIAASALFFSLASGPALAVNTPDGLWNVTFYNDTTPNLNQMATQGICFYPNGTWKSTTFPAWWGRWFQRGTNVAGNGDRVRILGNYAGGLGNDGAEVDYVNIKLMTGTWTEWRDVPANFSSFFAWTRATLTYVGRCTPIPAADEKAAREEKRNPLGGPAGP